MFRFNATQNLKKSQKSGPDGKQPVPSLNNRLHISSKHREKRLTLRGDYPRRVEIGDVLMGDEHIRKVSPVNGVAHYEPETDSVTLIQDGAFHARTAKRTNKIQSRKELQTILLDAGLEYFDYPGQPIHSLFHLLDNGKARQVILSPFSLQNFIDYRTILQKDYNEPIQMFKQTLISLYPEIEISDFIQDNHFKYEYPAGNPRYFLYRYCQFPLEQNPADHGKIYLGAETLYHILRAIYENIPFYQRHITIFIKNHLGELEGEPRHIALRNGMNLKDFFFQYRETHKFYTINSFYNQNPVFKIDSDFTLDIYEQEAFIICDDISSASREKICIDCNHCSSYCPVDANPRGILDKQQKSFLHNICLECGICTLFCPAHINFFERIKSIKKEKNHVLS